MQISRISTVNFNGNESKMLKTASKTFKNDYFPFGACITEAKEEAKKVIQDPTASHFPYSTPIGEKPETISELHKYIAASMILK